MYEKPRVERFGSFRELTETQVLFLDPSDGFFICGPDQEVIGPIGDRS
jgi:hypothetical protein